MCYFLRIIANEEARILQGSCGEDSNVDSEQPEEEEDEDLSDGYSSRSSSSSNRHQGSRKKEVDIIKDARELFCWKGRQKELVIAL